MSRTSDNSSKGLFSSKILPISMFCASTLLLFGTTLFLTDLNKASNYRSIAWTESAGLGLSVPACSSASNLAPTCVGGAAEITVSWSYGGQHGTCLNAYLNVGTFPQVTGLPCAGSQTRGGLASNQTFTYNVGWNTSIPGPQECTGGFDKSGNCTGWSPGTPTPAQDLASGGFTTPNCSGGPVPPVPPPPPGPPPPPPPPPGGGPPPPPPPPGPTAVNIFAAPSVITKGQSTVLVWTSNGTSCAAPWTASNAASGSQEVSPPETTFFSIACIGPGGLGVGTAPVIVGVIDEGSPAQ